jgi:hypothetical protein
MSPLTHSTAPRAGGAAATGSRSSPGRLWNAWALAARLAGAVALVVVGVVHLYEYAHFYSAIPTIGPLFLLNFAGAVVLSLALLSPLERRAGRRGELLVSLAALAGAAQAAIGFVFLAVSEHGTLFGFHEPGYDPGGMAVTRVAEVAAVVLLGAHLVIKTSTRRR